MLFQLNYINMYKYIYIFFFLICLEIFPIQEPICSFTYNQMSLMSLRIYCHVLFIHLFYFNIYITHCLFVYGKFFPLQY